MDPGFLLFCYHIWKNLRSWKRFILCLKGSFLSKNWLECWLKIGYFDSKLSIFDWKLAVFEWKLAIFWWQVGYFPVKFGYFFWLFWLKVVYFSWNLSLFFSGLISVATKTGSCFFDLPFILQWFLPSFLIFNQSPKYRVVNCLHSDDSLHTVDYLASFLRM